MSRNAVIITLDALKELCKTKLKIGTEDFEIEDLSSTIIKDISKIQFDFENYDLGNADFNFEKYPTDYKGYHNYPVGYEVLSNGLPVLFVNAGGDWECPICFCIYYDGKTLRGYVPTHGNVFNIKEKCAYGSEDDPEEYMDTVLPEGDPEKIKEDIINHIKIIEKC